MMSRQNGFIALLSRVFCNQVFFTWSCTCLISTSKLKIPNKRVVSTLTFEALL